MQHMVAHITALYCGAHRDAVLIEHTWMQYKVAHIAVPVLVSYFVVHTGMQDRVAHNVTNYRVSHNASLYRSAHGDAV